MYTSDMEKGDKMTLKQAMNFLGIKSPATMRKYADKGVIPCEKVPSVQGGWRIFRRKDLEAFKARMLKDPANGLSYVPYEPPQKPKK